MALCMAGYVARSRTCAISHGQGSSRTFEETERLTVGQTTACKGLSMAVEEEEEKALNALKENKRFYLGRFEANEEGGCHRKAKKRL